MWMVKHLTRMWNHHIRLVIKNVAEGRQVHCLSNSCYCEISYSVTPAVLKSMIVISLSMAGYSVQCNYSKMRAIFWLLGIIKLQCMFLENTERTFKKIEELWFAWSLYFWTKLLSYSSIQHSGIDRNCHAKLYISNQHWNADQTEQKQKIIHKIIK